MEKKLLIITGNLGSGGLERVTANLANQYADMGWKVRIVCLLDPNKNIFYQFKDNIEISFFDKFYKNEAPGRIEKVFLINKWIKFIRKEVKAWQPTNILTMTLKICALTSIACKKEKNIRIVMREIIDPKGRSQFINKICFRICKDVDHIIFQTNWERQCYPKNLQVKGSIILNPAEVNVIATEPKKKIVTMGRLALKQKQQNVLIDAFSIFVKNQPDFILEIYGEGNDKAKIEQMIEKKGLGNNVYLMGAVQNVHEKISDAMIFVLTSESEGLSNALIEALLIGIPSISSDWNGVEDLIIDGENGLLFKRGSSEELADKMLFLSNNPDIRKKLSKNGYLMREKFAFKNIFPLYRKAIEGEIGNL